MGIAERKQREFLRREGEILGAALSFFDSDRWQSVTVDQIAEKAEIGKGTVYKHFESKEEIYARLTVDFHRLLLQRLRKIDAEAGVVTRVGEIVRAIWETHVNHPEYHRVLEYTTRTDFWRSMPPRIREDASVLDRELIRIYHGVLQEGIDQGLFPDRPLAVLLHGPDAAINGAVQMAWRRCLDDDGAERYIESLIEFVLAGVMYQDRVAERRRSA